MSQARKRTISWEETRPTCSNLLLLGRNRFQRKKSITVLIQHKKRQIQPQKMAKEQKHICIKRANSFAKRKQGSFILCVSSCGSGLQPTHLVQSPLRPNALTIFTQTTRPPDFKPRTSPEATRSNGYRYQNYNPDNKHF